MPLVPLHPGRPTGERTRDTGRTQREPGRRWYYLAKWVHPDWGLRAQVLSDNPWCVQCQQHGLLVEATDIDHVIPHDSNPDRFWDRGNLQGLCRGCHTRKTRAGQ
jgi:5-methylcytosine-specific restriction protein A